MTYTCPKCGQRLDSPDSRIGQWDTCPRCGNITTVPQIPVVPVAQPTGRQTKTKQCPKCRQWIDKKATKCPYCRSKQPQSALATGLSVLVLLFCVCICTGICNRGSKTHLPNSPTVESTPSHEPTARAELSPLPQYEVVDSKDYDAPVKTQIAMHVVVSERVTESELRRLLQSLYENASARRGFKFNGGKPTHIFIYLYTSRERATAGWGEWVAMLSKIGEGAQPEVRVRMEQ